MIIARGYRVELELADGRTIRAPARAELLHDESGKDWPADSGLIADYQRSGRPLKRVAPHVRKHFGEEHQVKKGKVTLPPRALSKWTRVGEVKTVSYVRRGDYHAPEGHEHTFGERRRMSLRPAAALPRLYRRGELLRIDGVEHWDWAGLRG